MTRKVAVVTGSSSGIGAATARLFARNGYNGSSHGCVNVRNMTLLKRLYNAAPVGTKVVVHW